jgi:hypothetical protein
MLMKRKFLILLILAVLLSACQLVTVYTGYSSPPVTAIPTPTVTTTLFPTQPIIGATSTPPPVIEGPLPVYIHPDGGLYPGDQVSFELVAPDGVSMAGRTASIEIDDPNQSILGPQEFAPSGIAGRMQATFEWAWDTTGLSPGDYVADFSIQSGGPAWTETISLLPGSAPAGQWASATNDCCSLLYITGTQAEQDLGKLLSMVDEQATSVSRQLGAEFEEPVSIVFLPRVLGHGGFADDAISISYLERNYAGSSSEIVLHHELVHKLDSQLGGDLRPAFFVEGLAVYLSGGHFKPEPLIPRAAALLEQGMYLPLAPLAERFYSSQHEIGYLEASALIEYMIERWGNDAFFAFYRDIHPVEGSASQAAAINAALLKHFQLSFGELENDFLQYLSKQPFEGRWEEDVRLSVRYYDTVRRYQQALDPSAYYMTAWLPDNKQMRERDIVADYLRHPASPENVAIETLLVAVNEQLNAGDYHRAGQLLDVVDAALQAAAKEIK